MVGTTRPRVSEFMQRFRDRGLIDITPDSRILVREQLLRQYLEMCEQEPGWSAAAC
jgi:DNA-binding FadR family transcriptional regulator